MPLAAPKPCAHYGCGVLVRDGSGRCEAHQRPKDHRWDDIKRGDATARGYGGPWKRLREQILRRDRKLCQPSLRAGRYVPATSVDHIIPKARGGTDDPSNLQAIGTDAHIAKSYCESRGRVWDEAEWRDGLMRQSGAMRNKVEGEG